MALLESSSAGVTAAIVASLIMAVIGLLVAVWFWVRRMALRALEEAKKTARGTLYAADPMASYVARTDRGLKQAKGNAALVLSEQTLVCLRWVPRELTVL